MNFAARPFIAAALGAAGAAAIAVSLAASAAADPSDVAAQIAADGQSEISFGLTLFNDGDYSDGLNYLVNGENNVLIAAPEDAYLAQIESSAQEFYYSFYDPTNQLPFPSDFAEYSADLQFFLTDGQAALNQAGTEFASGATNLADILFFHGLSDLTVGVTEEAFMGPLYIAFANLGI